MRIFPFLCTFLFGRFIRPNDNGLARAFSSRGEDPEKLDDLLEGGNDVANRANVLLLPSGDGLAGVRTLAVGDTMRLDELGPIILNEDGTISRITNWDELTQREKDKTFKMIARRNAERAKVLSAKLPSNSASDEKPMPDSSDDASAKSQE